MFFSLNPVRIEVDKLKLRCNIGFSSWEQNKLQDVEISYSFSYFRPSPSNIDDESSCVDYKLINKCIISLVSTSSFKLLESLTEAVFSEISRQKGVFDVIVSISKPHALRFTDNVSVKISDKERNSLAILSIGSNIDPLNSINKSLELLHTKVNVLFVAELVPTKAIGMADQPDFLNSLAVIKTNLSSQALKAVLLDIEKLCGRVRGENKNAARTIDLDLIRWGSHTFDEADLRYPFFQEMLSKFVPGLIAS